MSQHVMVDLETWGTAPGSALRSIGAIVFNPRTGLLGDTFYANVDWPSQEAVGLTKEQDTIDWWSQQGEAAQRVLEPEQEPIAEALARFSAWWLKVGGQFFWSHGANFDEVLLQAAYRAADMGGVPWKFWDVRCSRTVLALGNRRPKREGTIAHYAIDDARAQAIAVSAALRAGVRV